MVRELQKAQTGKEEWEKICNEISIGDDCAVLVMAENDSEWNSCFLRYVDFFCRRKNLKKVVILSTLKEKDLISESKDDGYSIIHVDRRTVDCLMNYYLLIKFSDNIVFCLKDIPNDNRTSFILNNTDISLDEYVCYGAYKLREVPNV